MKITFLSAFTLSSVAAVLSGCVDTPDGHTTGGFPTKDTVISRYERPVQQVTAATSTVLTRDGKMLVDNIVDNTFRARINQCSVWVKVWDIDGKITQTKVQARGSMGGDIELAAQIDKEIALQVEAMPKQ
jgi:hypothetical protein